MCCDFVVFFVCVKLASILAAVPLVIVHVVTVVSFVVVAAVLVVWPPGREEVPCWSHAGGLHEVKTLLFQTKFLCQCVFWWAVWLLGLWVYSCSGLQPIEVSVDGLWLGAGKVCRSWSLKNISMQKAKMEHVDLGLQLAFLVTCFLKNWVYVEHLVMVEISCFGSFVFWLGFVGTAAAGRQEGYEWSRTYVGLTCCFSMLWLSYLMLRRTFCLLYSGYRCGTEAPHLYCVCMSCVIKVVAETLEVHML